MVRSAADDRRNRSVGPLLGGTRVGGRHRSLATLELRGIPDGRVEGFIGSLTALGFRVSRSGKQLVVPNRDLAAVRSLLDLERLGTRDKAHQQRFDDRWWFGLVDAASDLADVVDPEGGIEPAVLDQWSDAHSTFVKKGVHAGFTNAAFGRVLGLADAVDALLRSGRPAQAVDCAGALVVAAQRLR